MSKLTRREFFSILTLKSIKTAKHALAIKNIAPLNLPAPRHPGTAMCAACYASFDPAGDELLCPDCCAIKAKQQSLLADLSQPA